MPTMAYFCLTLIQESAKDCKVGNEKLRKAAARKYSVECEVLNTLGRLSTGGAAHEARKAGQPPMQPLTQQEREWTVEAVKALIRRAGEYAYDPDGQLPQVTMADLPAIE